MSFTALILNPIHEGAAAAERELAAFGPIRTYRTTPDSPGPAQVAQALSDGAESLVVAGGDGTQRLVAGAWPAAACRWESSPREPRASMPGILGFR